MHLCHKCQSQGPFYPSFATRGIWICKACTLETTKAHRMRDPQSLLSYRLYNAERRRGVRKCRQRPALVGRVLKQFNYRSAISGESDIQKLCIAPYFRQHASNNEEEELAEWNCVLVTCKEARSLAHVKSEDKAHARFPVHIQREMCRQREMQGR